VEQERRENGAIPLALDRAVLRRIEELARLVIAQRRRLVFAALCLRPLDALDGIMGDGVLVAEIFESRCRIVPPPSPRCAKSSRQAMMWARVTDAEIAKGLKILSLICDAGLVLAPEIVKWKTPHADGSPPREQVSTSKNLDFCTVLREPFRAVS
jgi:hypothetical protein